VPPEAFAVTEAEPSLIFADHPDGRFVTVMAAFETASKSSRRSDELLTMRRPQ
jgi:hypothetical protein